MTDGIAWLAAPGRSPSGATACCWPGGWTPPRQDAHRIALAVLEGHFALTLPRTRILEAPLPTVVLETA
ncbi:hypothetical protein OOK13_20885 [Streptomyces sp. NBC_00378]|uniref:hypothetical protein n=1 Tax=unclassified Streptomyces TaxID=2593676 RepID=UPI0022533628|nr:MULTISPECIES: hypothetical protein [unclassified Streptomyces]MCX5110958.1 hypothetical protein [Streptomyces sp. NBC_00378]